MNDPAHKILIDRYLNWTLVEERLLRYENIGRYYTLSELKDCTSVSPFYCHYLGWRLGVWKNEKLFSFFDALLGNAAKLPNWSKDRIPRGCEFDNFWSFMWELQVAQLFSNYPDICVEWTSAGPDLKISSNEGVFFVECTVYRKSFGLEEFVGEFLSLIHPWIRSEHIAFNIFSLPKNKDISFFLDELFTPFLSQAFLNEKLSEAKNISPVILPTPKDIENFYIFIENPAAKEFASFQPWVVTGPPEDYLTQIAKESLDNKRYSNNLGSHRPNLLAVNLLLGKDFQTAISLGRSIPKLELGSEYDAVLLTACGIDEIPSLKSSKRIEFYDTHPIKTLLIKDNLK